MANKKNRREFVKTVALAATAPVVVTAMDASALAAADDPAKDARQATAQALAEIVRARFGKHLSDAQLKNIQQTIAQGQTAAESMKRIRLDNGDEPAFVFSTE